MLWVNTKLIPQNCLGFRKAGSVLAIIILLQLVATVAVVPSSFAQSGTQIQINAAGATFPYPLIQKWTTEYEKLYPNVQFNYQALGSGTGVKDFIGYQMDFDASDAPLSTEEVSEAGGAIQIPETIGADVVAYNIPGIQSGMNLTGDVVADIFMGKITNWSDAKIQSLNPGMQLPSQPITVVHRSDGSGTTFVFTDYLSKVSSNWSTFVGKGKSVSWPIGVGVPQNQGVADAIQKNQYSIGYVELAYVLQHNTTHAQIQNGDGTTFVDPSEQSISNAVMTISSNLPSSDGDWSKVSITNAPGNDSYPISSMTYLLVHKDLAKVPGMTQEKAEAIINLIHWMVNDGQKYSSSLQYVQLPANIIQKDDAGLSEVTFNGTSLSSYGTVPEFGQVTPIILAVSVVLIMSVMYRSRLKY